MNPEWFPDQQKLLAKLDKKRKASLSAKPEQVRDAAPKTKKVQKAKKVTSAAPAKRSSFVKALRRSTQCLR